MSNFTVLQYQKCGDSSRKDTAHMYKSAVFLPVVMDFQEDDRAQVTVVVVVSDNYVCVQMYTALW